MIRRTHFFVRCNQSCKRMTILDGAGRILYANDSVRTTYEVCLPPRKYYRICAKSSQTDVRICTEIANICDQPCLCANIFFPLPTQSIQYFRLTDKNYNLPVPKATLLATLN